MARWTLGWVLGICLATAGMYWGTNALVVARSSDTGLAMQSLAARGSPACTEAARLLAAAGDRGLLTALPDERRNWERSARSVLANCPTT